MSVIAIYGPTGSFKSTFVLTMPGRKFVFDLENGMNRVTWRFPDNSKYEIWNSMPTDTTSLIQQFTLNRTNKINPLQAGKREKYEAIVTQYVNVCARPDIDVVAIDTAKVLWDVTSEGYLQELQEAIEARNRYIAEYNQTHNKDKLDLIEQKQQLGQIEYRTPGDRMRLFMLTAKSYRKHLVLVNHERPVRKPALVNGKIESVIVPGQYEIDGFNQTERLSDWVLESKIDDNRVDRYIVIRKSPIGPELLGMRLSQSMTDGSIKFKGYDYTTLDNIVRKIDRETLI